MNNFLLINAGLHKNMLAPFLNITSQAYSLIALNTLIERSSTIRPFAN